MDDDGTRLRDLHDLRLHPDSVIAVEARQGKQEALNCLDVTSQAVNVRFGHVRAVALGVRATVLKELLASDDQATT